MRTHTLIAILVGVILAIGSIGAHSDGRSSSGVAAFERVDRTHKGDRLQVQLQVEPQVQVIRARAYGSELPEGCDALVSPLANRQLARSAAHCES
jgi:hypothetical protein